MTMRGLSSEARELNEEELNAVAGGAGILDSIVGAATKIWNLITSPAPTGVKGEAMDKSRDWID